MTKKSETKSASDNPVDIKMRQVERIIKMKDQKKGKGFIASKLGIAESYVKEVVEKGYIEMEKQWKSMYGVADVETPPTPEEIPEELEGIDKVNPDQPDAADNNIPEDIVLPVEIPAPAVIVEPKARVQEGSITEIIGKVVTILYSENKDIPTTVMIEDLDGIQEMLYIPSRIQTWNLFYRLDGKSYLNGMSYYLDSNNSEAELQRLYSLNKHLKFRCTKNSDDQFEVWAIVSTKWQKTTINDFLPLLEETFPGQVQVLRPQDEFHGGLLTIGFDQNDTMKYYGEIDAGALDGMHAVKGRGGASILACLNQLTVDVSKKLINELNLPKTSFEMRTIHLRSDEEEFKDKLNLIAETMRRFATIKDVATNIRISRDEASKILDYYITTKDITNKTKEKIMGYLGDEKIEQVVGTVWGLAMILTYIGTYDYATKGGVRNRLKRVGGELLIVTQKFPEYLTIIKTSVEEKNQPEEIVVTT